MLSVGLVLVSLFSVAFSTPLARNLQVHESRDTLPSGFALTGAADPDTTLNLRIALVQNNIDGLIDSLYDVSTPSSPHWRQHLSKSEVESFVTPTSETVSAVNSWLKENGIEASTASPAGDWLKFSVPVNKANELFDAKFSVFTHNATGTEVIRTMQYSIPAELKGHLDLVHPTITFPNPYAGKVKVTATGSKKPSNITSDALCDNSFTPTCIQNLYGIPTTKAPNSGSQIAVSGYIKQYANKADLQQFLETYRPDISSSTTFTIETIDDGSDPQTGSSAGDEANLDTQYTVGLATNIPVTFISVGSDYQDGALEGFLDTINYLLDESNPPQVLTTSYGSSESSVSQLLATKLCNAYAQLGARGVSILFASGDSGVGELCIDFVPTFPSGCPYITTVGATEDTSPEVAASFSSGGFSNYFTTPSYQSSAVEAYLNTLGNTDSGKFNTGGRAFPDVAAAGVAFNIVVDGSVEKVDGTSCASPTFASVIGLLNAQLLEAGQSTLGFLNPWLYSDAVNALNDITSGDNPGCFTNGFSAVKGWDPVTGLGTPNYPKLLSVLGV